MNHKSLEDRFASCHQIISHTFVFGQLLSFFCRSDINSHFCNDSLSLSLSISISRVSLKVAHDDDDDDGGHCLLLLLLNCVCFCS